MGVPRARAHPSEACESQISGQTSALVSSEVNCLAGTQDR